MSSFFDKSIRVVAHRGDSMHFPENSNIAFKSAVELGVDIIETDVHISSDGVIFIWHDDNTKKIDGNDLDITKRTWEELKKLDLGELYINIKGEKPFLSKGLKLMTFKEALNQFPNIRFNVDLKDRDDDLVDGFYQILKEEEAFDRVVIASFHTENLQRIRKYSDKVITSYGESEVLRIVILNKLKLTFLTNLFYTRLPPVIQVPETSGKTKVVTKSFIKALHKLGLKVQVWTVNNKDDMRRLYKLGVDGIMTDDPRTLLKITGEV